MIRAFALSMQRRKNFVIRNARRVRCRFGANRKLEPFRAPTRFWLAAIGLAARQQEDISMPSARYISSSPDPWVLPRPTTDACSRYHKHGPIQPMDYKEPGLLRRLFAR
jgi:ribosomal protein S18